MPPILNYTVSEYDDSIHAVNNAESFEHSPSSTLFPSTADPSKPDESPSHPNEPANEEESPIAEQQSHPEPPSSPSQPSAPIELLPPSLIIPLSEDFQINPIAVQEKLDSDSLIAPFPLLETQPIATKPENTSKYFDEASQQATEGLPIPFTQPSCIPLNQKLKRRPDLSSPKLKSLGFNVDIENLLECRMSRLRWSGGVDGSRCCFRGLLLENKEDIL